MKKNLAFLSGLLCSALISAQAVTSTVSRNVQEAAPLNRDIQSVSAEKAESAIKITMHFNSKPVLKGNDKIIIMIDDTAIGGKTPTEFRNRNFKNPATYTKANSSVDYTYITIPNGSNYGACKTNFTWKSIGDDLFEASEQDLTFTISMDYITADAKQGKAGDTYRIITFISDLWANNANPQLNGTSHIIDVIPASGVAIGKTQTDSDTAVISFEKVIVLE